MKKWRRRLRAAIGMGVTWGLAWFGAGMVLLLVVGFGAADVPFPLFFGLLGFVAGATFSGVLALGEGGRRFHQMSLPRFVGWGAVGGVLLAGMFVLAGALLGDAGLLSNLPFLAPLFAVAGAGSAAGSLALARTAEGRDALDASADPDEAELPRGEGRERLGGGSG